MSQASSIIPAQRSNSLASISIGGTSSMELDLSDNKEDEEDKWWRREGNRHKISSKSTISWPQHHPHPWHRISSGDEELRQRIAELTKWDEPIIPRRRHHRRYKYDGLLGGGDDDHFGGIWPPPPIPSSFPLSRPSIADGHHQIPYPLWDDIGIGNGRRIGGKNKRKAAEEEDIERGFGWRTDYLAPFYTTKDDDFLLYLSKPFHHHHDLHHFHWNSPNTTAKYGNNNNKSETTYRMEFTPKIAPKPLRAKGPKDNFVLAQQNGLGFPLENLTTNKNTYLEFDDNWLMDRSMNCRAKKALGLVHRAKPRAGHYFFQFPTNKMFN